MPRFTFSLKGLLVAVALAALGLYALCNANQLLANGMFTLTLVACVVATITALFAGAQRRAFGGGFAIAGWSNLIIVIGNLFGVSGMPVIVDALEFLYPHVRRLELPPPQGNIFIRFRADDTIWLGDQLVGDENELYRKLLHELKTQPSPAIYVYQDPEISDHRNTKFFNSAFSSTTGTIRTSAYSIKVDTTPFSPERNHYFRVGHCLWTLLFGFFGGLVAVWVSAPRHTASPSAPFPAP